MTGDRRPLAAALAVFVVIGAIGVGVVANDNVAKSAAAGNAIRPAEPVPGPPVPQPEDDSRSAATKPTEMSPPIADTVPGDGSWVIGKEIKLGAYRTAGRVGCYWQRLQAHPSGKWLIIDSAQRDVAQTVVLGKDDTAFASQGCPEWELVR